MNMQYNNYIKTIRGGGFNKYENIWWVKDSAGIIIVDNQRKLYWLLTGFEETLWHLVALNHPFESMIEITGRCFSLSTEEAQKMIFNQFDHWINEGIMQVAGKPYG
ncbi:MAG: hypothetical protein AB9891_12975 [Anaerolineaceae bacterium]